MEVIEINYLPPIGKPKKSQRLRFSAEKKRNVQDGKMLTDESWICFLVKQQFDAVARNKLYVQIICDSSLHWVCIPTHS